MASLSIGPFSTRRSPTRSIATRTPPTTPDLFEFGEVYSLPTLSKRWLHVATNAGIGPTVIEGNPQVRD